MNIREWALITFTILAQMAAGAMLVLMVVHAYLTSKASAQDADAMLDGPLFIVVPIMGLALLASLLHLNNLVNVVKAVPNLDSSWLSREVVLGVVFVVLAVVYTFLQWRKLGSNMVRTVIGWITAVVGLSSGLCHGYGLHDPHPACMEYVGDSRHVLCEFVASRWVGSGCCNAD